MTLTLAPIVAIIGILLYFYARDTRVQQVGIASYVAGLTAFLIQFTLTYHFGR